MSAAAPERPAWWPAGEPAPLSDGDARLVSSLEADLAGRLAAKPRRLAHSLSVADTAEALARAYGVDPVAARVAGILHDWDKALGREELLARARELGVDMGVALELVVPLLHGIVAARELPGRYPWLSAGVLRAIEVHTTGCADPTPLDMVVFVADGIESLRPASPGIESVRASVGGVPLGELYWRSFASGVAYVIETGRYLYPGTVDTYNALVLARERGGHPFTDKKEHA